jgi:TonB-linked SusC/RagA family outer membrane protein
MLFSISAACFSQINGIVTDNKGLPLPGVNISAGEINAATDFEGNFTIDAAPGTALTFTMIGFKTRIVTAADGMNVVMEEEVNTLNEVVVIGYGTKKSGSITGSVAQIKSAEIVKTPAQSAIQAIQGRAAGINIVASDEPGAQPTIRIRGLGTITGGRDPLYIVDGVESGSLPSPNEIATIDILKDASSLAIYGQKGSNGVVIVSTKKGKSGKLVVNYDTYYGQKFIQHKVEMADSFRFAYYNNYVQGSTTYFNQEQPYNTDWFDEITGVGEVQSHYVSMAGGSENANYYFGVTNYKEKGILNGTEYERTNLNSRNEFRILGDRLKINPNMNIEIVKATDKPNGAFTTAYKQSPIVPVRFDNGRWGVPLRNPATGLIDINGSDRFNNVGNPVADLYYTNSQSRGLRLSGSISAELKLTDWLKYTSNFGASYFIDKSFNYTPNADLWLAQNPTQDLIDYEGTFGTNEVIYNTLTQNRNDEYLWNWDNYFTLHKIFGKHDLTGTLGMSRTTKNDNETLSGTRRNVPAGSNYWYLDLSSYNTDSAPGDIVRNSHVTPVVSIAYFARAEYEYDNKYLLTAVVRREGTSAFQTKKQWQIFPSVSAGWIISNEKFMSDSKLFDFLKIRGGYGEVGNGYTQNSTNNVVFNSGYNYAFGVNQGIFPGSVQPYQPDENLSWETMAEIDLGLDFKMFDNRLSGVLDVYNRESSDLIVPIDLPQVVSPDRVTVNAGKVINKGIEASLRWDGKINDRFTYWISGNYSYNENEFTEVANSNFANYIGGSLGNGAYTKQVLVGQPLGSFYVFDVTGFDSSGNFTYSAERVAAGSYIPKYTYGLTVGVNYRNFDISADLYGVGGNKIYNGKKAQRFGGENIEYDYLDSFWTPSTPNAENPTPYNGIPIASTYFIEDGSYLRINNITVGYTIPKLIKQVDKLRVYITAINPFVFTKYTGYSPEVLNDGDPLGTAGIELDAYPTNKTFLVGLNVSF